MKRLVAAGLSALLATPALAQDGFDWLEGCWRSEDGLSREVWSGDEGDVRFGYSATLAPDGGLQGFEQLRLETIEGEEAYLAYPGGVGPTRFDAVILGPGRALFVNTEHDFPQVIDYARQGRELVATISALDGESRVGFRFSPCPRGG